MSPFTVADITLSSREWMFGEGQLPKLPVTHDNFTAFEVLRVDELVLGPALDARGLRPRCNGDWSVPKASSNGFRRRL